MKFPSWIEMHGAMTHFPIVLLIVGLFVDFLVLCSRERDMRRTWKRTSFFLLALATVSFIPSLLSGYFAGQGMKRLPLDFDMHWKAAVVAAGCAAIAVLWRLAARDKLYPAARIAAMTVVLFGACSVSYTGYLGGQMVFGDGDDSTPVTAATPAPVAVADPSGKLEVAAGKMEVAAGKLDVAADRLALASGTAGPPAKPVTVKVEVKQAPAPPAPPTPASPNDEVARRLEKVAERYEKTAAKLGRVADNLAANAAKKPAKTPDTTSTTVVVPQATPASTGSQNTAAAADAALIAAGEKVYANEDLGCGGCHKLNGKGGRGGPALDGTGTRHPDADWQARHVRDPKSQVPGSRMPPYTREELSDEDLKALGAYLASLK